jgi:3-deoxy-7-phosphoheptulonate synthase
VGFKNGTDGNVRIALDAVLSASHPHHFLAVTKEGRSAIAATTGNPDCHVILRGGKSPNYDPPSVAAACRAIGLSGGRAALMIDASHDNSGKTPENQPKVLTDIGAQVAGGDRRIIGVMIESNLVGGRQTLVPGQPLVYGQSITDGCIDWATTEAVLEQLAESVVQRRIAVEVAVA